MKEQKLEFKKEKKHLQPTKIEHWLRVIAQKLQLAHLCAHK
ncbi:hypothetical protein [Pseudoalteromonas sp. SMS1]|nr:hypothetical protein [Pseudoalteromonas sp. SMS1]